MQVENALMIHIIGTRATKEQIEEMLEILGV